MNMQAENRKNFSLQLSDNTKLPYENDQVTVEVTYYDADENKIASTDTTQKVKSFEIKVIPKTGVDVKAKYMNLESLQHICRYISNAARNFMVFKNKAELPEHHKESEAQHTIKKDKILSKQSIANIGRDYNTPQSSLGIIQMPQFVDGN